MGQLNPIIIKEQQQLNADDRDYICSLALDFWGHSKSNIPAYLGLSSDGWSSYFVGASWLKNGARPLIVLPKFEKIDFIRIFANAIKDNVAPEYFDEAYSINLDSPAIQAEKLNSVLSPLMVSHFLCVIRRLLKHGLKHNYIIREDNLKCKIKGHVLTQKNLQKNIIRGHAEQIICRYQEYSLDYPENRLLKRALLASKSLLLSLKSSNNDLLRIIQTILLSFEGVSSDIASYEVKSIRKDKLHGEYPLAIKLAKQILRRTDFSISEHSSISQYVPEFSIDMSRIFEFYVLGLLKAKYQEKSVLFQEYAGIMGRCDYLIPSEHLIIDAKYKSDYPNRPSDVLRTDIREVVGYGRSNRILKKIEIEAGQQPTCIIIYPSGEYKSNEKLKEIELASQSNPLDEIDHFYTLGIAMPTIE